MSLISKIKIAELQQSIAEIEAKKKLSEKREERYIEEGIHNIQRQIEKTKSNLSKSSEIINKLNVENTELKGLLSAAESKYKIENESKKVLQDELKKEKQNTKNLQTELTNLNTEFITYKNSILANSVIHSSTIDSLKNLQGKLDRTEAFLDILVENYPHIFKVVKSENAIVISVKVDASTKLSELNNSLKLRTISQEIKNKF